MTNELSQSTVSVHLGRTLGGFVKTWRPLRPGDTIDLVAPAFACTPDELEAAAEFIKAWGYEPRLPERIFRPDVLCASPDLVRFNHLKRALVARDSKAVWCLRGGYGSIRIVSALLKVRPPGQPKLFVGLSDITTLHLFLNQHWRWPTLHGPMMDRLGRRTTPPKFVRELKRLVSGAEPRIEFSNLLPLNQAASKRGQVRGPITGGNLITLQSSLGTRIQWQTRGTILFLEDIGERAYKVDRVLEHFRQAGVYKGIRAIVFGDFTGSRDPDGQDRVPQILKRFALTVNVPVLKGIKSGHGVIQRPIPFGPRAELHLGSRARLVVPSGVSR